MVIAISARRTAIGYLVAFTLIALLGATARAAEPVDPKVAAFRAECAAKAAAADKADTITVAGKDGWLYLASELRHLSVGAFWGEGAAKVSPRLIGPIAPITLPAILDFKAQLDKAGIELILLPVPPKAAVYPEMVSTSRQRWCQPRIDVAHQQFYDLLRKSGINVIDLTADLIAHKSGPRGPVFCKQDTHWSGYACELAARRVSEEIKSRPWLGSAAKLTLTSESRAVEINGDLRQALPGDKPAAEKIALRFVGVRGANGALAPVEVNHDSPILLVGDSHTLVFHSGQDMLAQGAGLADQLALELGIAVDLIGVRGSGATPARVNFLRAVRADAGYLAKKKLVIWCFTAREFTEGSGWAKVPIVK